MSSATARAEGARRRRVLLVNPNGNRDTTDAMADLARREIERLEMPWTLSTATGSDVPDVLLDAADLERGKAAVERILRHETASPDRPDAVIVAAFADPGLNVARSLWPGAAFGIGEAGLREGHATGRFAVVTTTPDQIATIEGAVTSLGLQARWSGVWLTEGSPESLMRHEGRLSAALQRGARSGGSGRSGGDRDRGRTARAVRRAVGRR